MGPAHGSADGRRPGAPLATPPIVGYDAFISYSHAADGMLAPALQAGLHRFAKPWYRLRALRVFRDEASLSANPALWDSIVEALEGSRWFLLLASPEAAGSEWVSREVGHWCAGGRQDRLIVVLTGGEMVWDTHDGDFDWHKTTALPVALRGAMRSEPRHVDLRWAKATDDVSLANAQFRDAVADIAAAVHGRPKDEMLGADVQQHRRLRRLVGSVIATLAVLLVFAVGAALIAVNQREQAHAERDRAEAEARVALSRQLAAEAVATTDDQFDVGLLLAAHSYAVEPTVQSRGSLAQILLRSPYLAGYLPETEDATALAIPARSELLAVGTAQGVLTLWSLPELELRARLDGGHAEPVTAISFDGAGDRVATGTDSGRVSVWDVATGGLLLEGRLGTGPVAVALADHDDVVAVAGDGITELWRIADAVVVNRLDGDLLAPRALAFDGSDHLVVADGQGRMLWWDPGSDPPNVRDAWVGGGQPLVSAYSADMTRFAGAPLGVQTPYIFDVSRNTFLHDDGLRGPALTAEAMAFSADGQLLASAGEGRAVLWDVDEGSALDLALPGVPGPASAVVIAPNGRFVTAAAQRGVAVYDLEAHAVMETVHVPGAVPITEVPNVIRGGASVAFSPDGRLLAWGVQSPGSPEVVIWDTEEQIEVMRVPAERVIGFDPAGRLAAGGMLRGEGPYFIADPDVGRIEEVDSAPWPETNPPGTHGTEAAAPWTAESGGIGASVAFDGTLTLWDTVSGQALSTLPVPGALDFSALAFDPAGTRLAVATAGGALSVVHTSVEVWHAEVCARVPRLTLDATASLESPCP